MPPQCALCRASLDRPGALCAACWIKVDFIERPLCARLGLPFPYDIGPDALSVAAHACDYPFDRVRSATVYRGSARELVLALKFRARTDVAPMMARWMARAGAEVLADADLLAPVPMHRLRLLARRQNHAALLTRRIGRIANRSVMPDTLVRRRNTPQQTGLSATARARNLAGAIIVRRGMRKRLAGASIVLVDDVFTTGSTAEACARALKREGAVRVDVLTFARVVGDAESAI